MRALKHDSVVPLERSARLLGRKITLAWQKSVEGILEAGNLLIQAKDELAHGDFERMVASSCPFGIRTARYLMTISAHPVLSNRQSIADLPAAWGTLAELSKFEPQELSHAIGNHWVKPEMTREDVGHLHRRVSVALGTVRRSPTRREPNVVQKVVGGMRRLNPNRILRAFVDTLESLVPSCEMIDPSKVDPGVLSECIVILDDAMGAIAKLRSRLIEWQRGEAA